MNYLKGFPKRYKDSVTPTGIEWWEGFYRTLETINNGGIALLYGKHGTGKTRMAYEIAKVCAPPNNQTTVGRGSSMVKRDLPCVYTTAVNLFMEIRETYKKESERTERGIINDYSNAAFLVIDEIQDRGETAFEDQKLTAIIDARYMDNKPTLLISNHDRKRFAESLSPAVLDRIRENGCGVHFSWESYRKGDIL